MATYDIQTLLRLEANPAYKLNEEQRRQLAEYRKPKNIKANSKFKKHNIELEEESNAGSHRN